MTYDTKSSGNVIKRHEINDLSPETCDMANFLAPLQITAGSQCLVNLVLIFTVGWGEGPVYNE